MSTVLFSKTFITNINTILRRFWWAGVQEEQDTSPIAFRSWEDICKSKEQGGLGIRDMELVNKSLIIHSAWNVATNKNPFLTAILKAKYYPNHSFWTAPTNGTWSVYWSSVMQVKDQQAANSKYQLHAGNSSIWSSPWSPVWDQIHDHLLMPVVTSPLPDKVCGLWNPDSHSWNHQLPTSTFSDEAVNIIQATPVVTSDHDDILRWTPAKKWSMLY